uniref:Uncharacterized protein n=1 Tax=Arundo donax TaxID=35708 RepID=A0A0A9DT81_ARUDO
MAAMASCSCRQASLSKPAATKGRRCGHCRCRPLAPPLSCTGGSSPCGGSGSFVSDQHLCSSIPTSL